MSAAKDKLKVLLVNTESALYFIYGEHTVLSTAATAQVLMKGFSFNEAFSQSKQMWNERKMNLGQ